MFKLKIVFLKQNEFEDFESKHELKNFYQTISYGHLMTKFGFQENYIGFVEGDTLIGASLILSRPIFMGFKYGYAPHGLLLNYTSNEYLEQIAKKLKSFLLKQGFLILKIDPLIIKSIRDKDGNIISENVNIQPIMDLLKKLDFSHCGFNNYLESVKPRWHAILPIENLTTNQLFYNMEKQVRNKLRKSIKFGIEIYKGTSTDIEKMYSFIKEKGNYSLKYYEEFQKTFNDNFEIYFARLNTNIYVLNSTKLYDKESEINDYLSNIIQNEGSKGKDMRNILNKKMESDRVLASYKRHLIKSTKLLKDYPDGLIIGGSIIIKYADTITFLIDGYNKDFSNLSPNYLSKWYIIEKYSHTGIKYFDLNAISGDFKNKDNKYKGLNESKMGFNSIGYEYIGEFNLIVNKPIYALYRGTKDNYSPKNQQK